MTQKLDPFSASSAKRDSSMTDSNIDLQTVDFLLHKADALLGRHKKPASSPARDDDDIPVLTDIDDDSEETEPLLEADTELDSSVVEPSPAAEPPAAPEPPPQLDLTPVLEQLIDLETAISRQVESWFAAELSQLLEHEIEQITQRIHEQVFAQMRSTLLPRISEQISDHLAKIFSQEKS